MERVYVDSKTLIELVEKRPALWHQKNANYPNRTAHKQEWVNISKELKCSPTLCRTKWKNIRDIYRKECRKLERKIINKSRWCHFDKLRFLDNPVVETEIEWDDSSDLQFIKDETIIESTNSYDHERNEISDTEENSTHENFKPAPELTPAPNFRIVEIDDQYKYSKMRRINECTMENENSDNTCTKNEEENDSDYHFLMSLLPFLKKVPLSKKLSLRCRIQQLIAQAGSSET